MHSELLFDGKKYISSRSASRLTGYTSDYIGQLARSGKIPARRVGHTWYVLEESLLSHRAHYAQNGVRNHPAKAEHIPTSTTLPFVPTKPVPSVAEMTESVRAVAELSCAPTPSLVVSAVSDVYHNEQVKPELVLRSEKILSGKSARHIAKGIRKALAVPSPSAFSSPLVQKVGVLAFSVALVFGPYLARDSQTVMEAMHQSALLAQDVFDGTKEFVSFARAHRSDALEFLLSEGKLFASANAKLSADVFRATSVAADTLVHDVEQTGTLAITAFENGREMASAIAVTTFESFERGRERVSAVAVAAFESVARMSDATFGAFSKLQAAAKVSLEEASLFERLIAPFKNLARTTYSGISSATLRLTSRKITIILAPKASEPSASDSPFVKGSTASSQEGFKSPVPSSETNRTTVAPPSTSGISTPTITERTIERVIQEPSFTQADVDQKLALLQQRLSADIASLRTTTSQATQSNSTYINNVYNAVAATNNLDQADNLKLMHPVITDGTMTNTTLSNVLGTFTGLSGNSLSLSSSASVGGDLTVSGNATIYGTLTPSVISATSSISAPYFVATSTTATSTYAGGLAVQTDKFIVESQSGNVGLGTTTPAARLALSGYANSSSPLFLISTSTPTATSTALIVTSSGNVGIGSTTPTSTLSISGTAYITGNVFSSGTFTSTATAANVFPYASTTVLTVSGTASTTNLTVSSLTETRIPFLTTAGAFTDNANLTFTSGNLLNATYASTTFLTTSEGATFATASGNVGIGTTSPYGLFAIEQGTETHSLVIANTGSSSPSFVVNGVNGNGRVGIATSSPIATLSVSRTAGQRAFTVGSQTTTDLAVDGNGNVGIGTASPQGRLHISTASTDTAALILDTNSSTNPWAIQFGRDGASSAYVALTANQTLGWEAHMIPYTGTDDTYTLGTQSLRWNALSVGTGISTFAGNVGIGTTSPKANLGLAGSLGVNNTQLFLAANGNVGIGTSTPYSGNFTLQQKTNGDTMILGVRKTDTASTGDFITYKAVDGTDIYRVTNNGGIYAGSTIASGAITITSTVTPQLRAEYDSGNAITFATSATGTSTLSAVGTVPKLVFASEDDSLNSFSFINASLGTVFSIDTLNNRVGVGTTTPGASFAVQGNALVSGNLFLGGTLTSTSTLTLSNLGADMILTSNGSGTIVASSTPTAAYYLATSSIANVFPYASTTAISATGSAYFATTGGNVGIGTTSPYAKFALHALTGDTQIGPIFNVSSSTPTATTSLMTISRAGYVGVNTESPTSRLHVSETNTGGEGYTLATNELTVDPSAGSLSFNAVSNTLTVTGAAGVGDVRAATNALTISGGTLSNGYGASNIITNNNASLASGNLYGAWNRVLNTAGTPSNAYGSRSSLENSSGNSAPGFAYGVHGSVYQSAASTMTNAYGVYGYIQKDTSSAGAITNAYGLYSNMALVSGSISNAYGLYIANLSSVASTSYAVYTNGATQSYFGGNVGVGITAPTALTHISSTTPYLDMFKVSGATDFLTVKSSGNVGLGTTSPSKLLSVHGDALISGTLSVAGIIATSSTITFSGLGTNMLASINGSGNLVATSTPTAAYYLATSSIASIFPYASSTAISVSGTGYFGTASTTNLTVSSLTSTRIPFLTTAGAFTDDGDLTFTNGNLLNATYASTTMLTTSAGATFATASGNVGIGTTSPYGLLAIEQGTESASLWVGNTGSSTPSLVVQGVNGNGNVGIGTASPGAVLGVQSNSNGKYVFKALNSSGNEIGSFYSTATGYGQLYVASSAGVQNVLLDAGGGNSYINSGFVGIGTDAPLKLLDVVKAQNADTTVRVLNTDGGAAATAYFLSDNGTDSFRLLQNGTGRSYGASSAGEGLLYQTSAGMTLMTDNASGIIKFATGGSSEKVRIDAGGNLGLGTTTPTTRLGVQGDALISGNLSVAGLIATSSTITFSGLGTNMLASINGSGNLVATSTPTAAYYLATSSIASIFPYASSTALTVSGTGYFGTASTTNLTVSALTTTRIPFLTTAGAFTDDSDLTFTSGNLLNATYASTTFLTTSAGATFATASGNVGIGTTSPAQKLEVTGNIAVGVGGTGAVDAGLRLNGSSANDQGAYVRFARDYVLKGWLGTESAIIGGAPDTMILHSANNLDLYADSARVMTLDNGNVGIGTTEPGAKTHILNSATTKGLYVEQTGVLADNTDALIIYSNAAQTGSNAKMLSIHSDNAGSTAPLVIFRNDGTGDIFVADDGGTQVFNIKDGGNVGIGTTSPGSKLEVNLAGASQRGAINLLSGGATNYVSLGIGRTAKDLEIGIAGATNNFLTGSAVGDSAIIHTGKLHFGSVVDAAAQVTFDTSGNVGIGTTSPAALFAVTGGTGTYITSSGTVGIGVAAPDDLLHIRGTGNTYVKLQNSAATTGALLGYASGATLLTLANYQSDGITFQTSGANDRMRITSDGNVGIGTTSPYGLLSVEQGTEGASFWVGNTGSTTPSLMVSGVNGNGNVGIGVASPTAKLEVAGTMVVQENNKIGFRYSVSDPGPYQYLTANGATALQFHNTYTSDGTAKNYSFYGAVADTEILTVLGNGNVGIGTTGPGALLHTKSAAATHNHLKIDTTTAGTYHPYLDFSEAGTNKYTFVYYTDANFFNIEDGSGNSRISIADTTGNVGIGTTSPAALFAVGGAGYFTGNVGVGVNSVGTSGLTRYLTVGAVGSGESTGLNFRSNRTTAADVTSRVQFLNSASETARIETRLDSNATGGAMLFWTNTTGDTITERMRIDSSGNVGIGTTSPLSKLEIVGGDNVVTLKLSDFIAGTDAQKDAFVGMAHKLDVEEPVALIQGRSDGTDNKVWIGGAGLSFNMENAATEIGFFTATTDTTLNGTQQMVIKSTGNVGIGTTSPSKLLSISGVSGAPIMRLAVTSGSAVDAVTSAIEFRLDSGTSGGQKRQGAIKIINTDDTYNRTGRLGFFTSTYGAGSDVDTEAETERLSILATTGNVGIGTTSPIGKLHIFGNEPGLVIEDDGWTGGASALYKLNVSNTDGRFMVQRNTAVARDFSTYNEDLVISNAGNVGIGTTAPRAPLAFSASVGEKIRLYDDAANNIYGLDVQNGLLRIYAGSSPDDIGLGSRSGSTFTEAVRIKGSGNVGIGTTSPLSKLAVSGGASVGADYNIAAPTNGMIIQGNLGIGTTSPASLLDLATPTNGATNEYGTLRLGVLNSAASELYTIGRKSSDGVLTFKSHQNDAGGFRFNTQTSGADAERLTITNAGNVGIGTTSPTQKLVVSGGAISLDNNQSLNFNDTGGTSRRAVLLSSTNISLGDVDNNGFNTYILSGADNPIIFRYGTGESMRILGTTGNVGIGTTSPATKLEVAGAIRGGSFPQSTTNTGEAWVGRAADRTLGTFTLQLGGASAAGTSFEIVDRAWTKVISSISGEAPAGSLVVNSNGNVGIGTTAPEQKLHVYGSNAASLGYVLKLSHGDGLSSDIGVGILFSENATGDANRGKGAITYIGDGSGFDRGDFRFLQDSAADTGNPILSETVMIIKNGGNVGIGTIVPSGILSVTPTQYSTGTASQSLTTVTGVGTTWTSAMVGSQFVYADGTNGGTITAFTDTTHVTVSTSQTVASQAYKIAYTGLQVATTGNVGIGTVSPGAALHVSATMPDITSNPGIVQISSSDATAQNKGGTLTFGFNTSGGLVQNGAGIAGLKESATASNTAGYLALYSKPTGAANAERMRIDSTGNVGIGTTSPWAKLSVEGTVSFKSLTSSATGNAVCITTNNEITNAGGGTCTPSSLRFKENVVTLNKGFALDTLSQLRVTSFDYRNGAYSPEDGKGSYGMIAEEVAQIDPLLVDYGYDGQPLTLHFEKITGLLVQAVQEIGSVINLTGATTSAVTIDSQGNLGIGTSTPEYKLHVMGDVAATSFVNISTRTAKKDIEYYSESDKRSVSDKIRNIKIAEYRYNGESESAPLRLGLIAEEAPAEVLSASGKGVDVYKLSTFILAGLQEQQKRLEGLEVRIMALESLVASSTPQQGAGFSVASVAVAVKDLIASAGEWVVSKITAAVGNFGTAKVENGLEMKDSATGATYCVRITNGEWAKVQGSCAEASTPLNPPSEEVGGQTSSSGDTTAPILTVNGNNPATVAVGAVYADLGASVTDNVSTNLGVYALVNGVDVGVASNISINTASSTTYTIEYYAIDQAGNRGSAQRTVIVGAEVASAPAETVPDAVGTTTTSVLGSSTPAVAEETPSEPQPEVVEEIPTEPLTEATPEPAPVESESTPISESETATSTPAL